MNIKNTNFNISNMPTMNLEKLYSTDVNKSLTNANIKILNTIRQFIFKEAIPANPLSRAENYRLNIFCIEPMHIFAYLFETRHIMTVNPSNIKGGIMKFKLNILRTSTIVALSILSLTICAESAPVNPSANTAWQPYVGGSFGYSRLAAQNNWTQTTISRSGSQTGTGKNHFNTKGFLGGLHIGVQKFVSPTIKLGGELYGFLETNKASVNSGMNSSSRTESLKKENGGGLKLKAGYAFDTHSSLYAHLGVEKAGFKYAASTSTGAIVATSKKYLWGMPFGFGIETSFCETWTARVEYTHAIYQKWTTGVKPISTTATTNAKISPSQDSISLGLSYTF